MIEKVLSAYGLTAQAYSTPFGHGLINNTWKISDGNNAYILQKINTAIFKHPEFIAENINAVSHYLAVNFPGYFFCTPIKTKDGKDIVHVQRQGYFRLFPFVKNSHTINVAGNTAQTFQAAKEFAGLTKRLSQFSANTLKITLPDFHNITLRYNDFLSSVQHGNKERIKKSTKLISYLKAQKDIVDEYEKIKTGGHFKLRVTHHDTKINNILFNDEDKGICVIDLDTMMPGYFISDVGDMIRTHTSPAGEDETDFNKIQMRDDYFEAIATGYLSEMLHELTTQEIDHFVFAGKFLIYMQALRFLTDYFNNDVYYGKKYEDHNFNRAGNQAHLLQLLIEKENMYQAIVASIASLKST